MNILKTHSEEAFDKAAAEIILKQMRDKPDSVIGLSTGRTTGNMHRIVSGIFRDSPFDISGITFFCIDEVTGITPSNPWACKDKLKKEIIDDLGIRDKQFLTLPCAPGDITEAARDFYSEMTRRGGADLIILGLGENGHLGFNQPGTSFESRIHFSSMDEGLEKRIRTDCGIDDSVMLGGITLGLADIMDARKLVLAVKGTAKRDILYKVIGGPVSEYVPASILQRHPDCTVLTDIE